MLMFQWQDGQRVIVWPEKRRPTSRASHAAVEPAAVSNAGKVFAVALLAALAWAVAPVAGAQSRSRRR